MYTIVRMTKDGPIPYDDWWSGKRGPRLYKTERKVKEALEYLHVESNIDIRAVQLEIKSYL